MRTVADLIRMNARRHPGREAVVDETRRLTHLELAERAWGVARGLAGLGVKPGDTVGVLAGNGVFCAEAFLGIAAAGAVFVPYNWRWSTAELVAGVNETRAAVVLVEEGRGEDFALAERTGGLEHVRHVVHEDERYAAMLRAAPTGPLEPECGPEDPACVLFTGGTTGFSKGVVLSHRAVLANAVNEIVDCRVGAAPGDRGLITTPLFHSAGLLCWFVPHYATGATSVLMSRFDEQSVAETMERERVTNTFLVPNMISRLVRSGAFESPGVRRGFTALHSGAGLLRHADKEALAELLPGLSLYFRYGLTEAGPMVTRLRPADIMRRDLEGSIGREYLLAEAQVQDDEGRELPPGELGEICVRGPGLMTGYYRRPQATEDAFRAGWLRTGDLAVRDEEGFFFFRDRAKDMIKSGGENVYSAEIEQILMTHPAVAEAVVLGAVSEEWGEEVRAVVVCRPGEELTEAGVRDFVRGRLAGYKVPKRVAFREREQLPRSGMGKLLKNRLRDDLGWGGEQS
ncbi:class I adenylate-forming enzyme family protein [Streptomyces sp. PTD5-9]|uniref:class I adenylate-forming enzyme family protein n=1 Tax=Streptomyces sp. PTD5-9 TaxID=3120150 RepID=UPI00300BC1E8